MIASVSRAGMASRRADAASNGVHFPVRFARSRKN
jgi:hypothetical protein